MARTIWTGSLTFGLVTIPVGLYPATSDKAIHFNQFEEGTSDRIRYKKVNERTGEEVDAARIVRGIDLGGGEYVVLSDEELAAAEPKRSRTVEITDFVDLDEIDPVYYRTTYFLGPQNEAAVKPYALLQRAMQLAGKVAIATLVMRNKEYLVTVRPQGDGLALETMYFADEVRSADKELPHFPRGEALSEREVELATILVDAMSGEWVPDRYHDTYREQVQQLVEQKRQGHEIVHESGPAPAAQVVDLMEALAASVAATGRTPASAKETATRRRRAPAAPARAKVPPQHAEDAPDEESSTTSRTSGSQTRRSKAAASESARVARPTRRRPAAAGAEPPDAQPPERATGPRAKKVAKRPASARLREVS